MKIILPGVLREYAGGLDELVVPAGDGDLSLRTVLDVAFLDRQRLGARIRDETGALRRHVNIFVDGQDVRRLGGLDATVDGGAVIHILPSVAGG